MNLSKPCNQCPFKKDSLKGYLGDSTPLEFLNQSEAELIMPCHLHVDYEKENWKEYIETAPQCKGRSDFFRNRCKSPKNSKIVKGDRNSEVFDWPQDFYNHHSKTKDNLIIIGNKIKIT
jgi:hypothetical protein